MLTTGLMNARAVTLVSLLMAGAGIAGCITNESPEAPEEAPEELAYTDVRERHLLPFNLTDEFMSHTLEPGPFGILEPLSIDVPVALPATEGGHAATGAFVHMGVFLPDVPAGTTVPVVADFGPYWGESDVRADARDSGRLGETLIANLVPHGFAVAQVSVIGTGDSNHCMDLMGQAEQLGIDAAVTALGEADWSNGNVGLIGRSYDGSTPWEAAMFGNPALKTIVPISGLIGMHELMWRNGSAEFRGPIMHNVVYGTFGIDGDIGDLGTLCPDYLSGPVQGAGAYATGDHFVPQANDYWSERSFLSRVLDNYDGSVYLIQGLQDWNVDNHMAFPTHQLIKDNGNDIKGLYGQWQHMYPDRTSEHQGMGEGHGAEAAHSSVRFDWTQDLLEWFTFYLKQEGPQPALHAEVQDNEGTWHIEETYPPQDAVWWNVGLDETTKIHSGPDVIAGGQDPVLGAGDGQTETELEFHLPVSEVDQQITGNIRFHVTVTPSGPGGQLYAYLYDVDEDQRLGHAIMDLRFAGGGNEMQPVVPGLPMVAQMEFFALDALVPAGHTLGLVLSPTGRDYLPSAVSSPVMIDTSSASVLKIPTKDPATLDVFLVPGQGAASVADQAMGV